MRDLLLINFTNFDTEHLLSDFLVVKELS